MKTPAADPKGEAVDKALEGASRVAERDVLRLLRCLQQGGRGLAVAAAAASASAGLVAGLARYMQR